MNYVDNILAAYVRSTRAERDAGMSWYADAHAFALTLDPSNVWRAAGVIAALSPLKKWNLNMRYAIRAFETGIASGNMPGHNLIAQRILDGAHPLDVMNGDKTRHFAQSIATAGEHDTAVIDRHAHDIAMAEVFTDSTRKIGKRKYRDMAVAYGDAADWCEVRVAQMQAITWLTWKREKGGISA